MPAVVPSEVVSAYLSPLTVDGASRLLEHPGSGGAGGIGRGRDTCPGQPGELGPDIAPGLKGRDIAAVEQQIALIREAVAEGGALALQGTSARLGVAEAL